MKQWKVIFEYNDEVKEQTFTGERYSDVYIEVLIEYPGGNILSILEIPS